MNMTQEEKQECIDFYLNNDFCKNSEEYYLWKHGQEYYAERCKALLKAVSEYSDES